MIFRQLLLPPLVAIVTTLLVTKIWPDTFKIDKCSISALILFIVCYIISAAITMHKTNKNK